MSAKTAMFLAFLAIPLFFAFSDYQIIVADNGNAFVSIYLAGNGSVNIPLPADAKPIVGNALFLKSANGITVSLSKGKTSSVYYTTSMYTSKSSGAWQFSMPLSGDGGLARLSLPKDARVISLVPDGGMQLQGNSSVDISWLFPGAMPNISVNYSADTVPSPVAPQASGQNSTINASASQQDPAGDNDLPIAAVAAAALIFIAVAFLALNEARKRQHPQAHVPGPAVHAVPHAPLHVAKHPAQPVAPKDGMQKVLAMLGDNDTSIINLLMQNGGELKRALIEKRLGISKSSLALSLRRLSQKKVVDIDESGFTQKIRLSEWFKGL